MYDLVCFYVPHIIEKYKKKSSTCQRKSKLPLFLPQLSLTGFPCFRQL